MFAAAAIFLLNGIIALADVHHEGYVYDSNGWEEIAEGWNGKVEWAIDPNFPTNNHQGYNIRDNMRDAMDSWNVLRFSDAGEWADEITTFANAEYQYEECAGETLCYGSNIRQHHDDDDECDDPWGFVGDHNHDHGPICQAFSRVDHAVGGFTPDDEDEFLGALIHEMGHAFGLQHPDPSWTACTTIMNGCWTSLTAPGVKDEDRSGSGNLNRGISGIAA